MLPDNPMDALRWRCVRGKPKAEHLAARQLVASGFEAFCPRLRHQKKTVRGLVWYVEALFPGYLFVRFAPASLRHVAATPFVSQVLSFMEDFGAVPDSVVADLRSAVDADNTITVPMELEVGEQVDVVSGALRGQQAIVTRVLPGAQRVRILLEFLGNQQEIEISILSLLSARNPRAEVF